MYKIGWAPFVYCLTSGRVNIFSRYAYAFPSPTQRPTRAVSPLGMIHPKKPGAISFPMNSVTKPGSPRIPILVDRDFDAAVVPSCGLSLCTEERVRALPNRIRGDRPVEHRALHH